MKKEEFIALGIDEKLAEKAAEASKKELSSYVPKSRFDEVNDSKKQLETTVGEYKTQLETLKTSAGENEALKQQITDMQAQNQKKDEDYQKQIKDLQMSNAIKLAIADTAQDSELVAGLIDKTKLILGEDGKVTGLDEQLKTLKESKGFLFKEAEPNKNNNPGNGFKFGASQQNQNQSQGAGFTLKDAISEAINNSK